MVASHKPGSPQATPCVTVFSATDVIPEEVACGNAKLQGPLHTVATFGGTVVEVVVVVGATGRPAWKIAM